MKIKTAELTGKALDWALAKALGSKHITHDALGVYADDRDFPIKRNVFGRVNHTDPATCMTIMWSLKINIKHHPYSSPDRLVLAYWGDKDDAAYAYVVFFGSTVAEAVARCVVAMQFGGEVEVPSELCGGES